jgi:hypothetical protein
MSLHKIPPLVNRKLHGIDGIGRSNGPHKPPHRIAIGETGYHIAFFACDA